MIAPDVGIGEGLSVREIIERFNEPFVRERRSEKAYAELCAMSTGGRAAGAAPAAPVARRLGLSNCHISPKDRFPTPLHAWVHSPRAEELNQKCHAEYLDAKIARDKKRLVTFHYEGTLIRIAALPGWQEYEDAKQSKRGTVSGFSCKSRSRMQRLTASLRTDILPQFVTLTYPHEWNNDPLAWKADLDTFGKWFLRTYPEGAYIWKLEPQKRRAPHYHLLVYGVSFLPWQDVAVRWAEIVNHCKLPKNYPVERGKYGAHLFHEWARHNIENYDVADHVTAGVKVEAIYSRNGVMRYCSKNYMGKECALPEGWEKVGRFWGVVGRKNLPRSQVIEVEISREAFFKLRRTARRWFASKGLKRRGRGALTLFTSAHWQWLRVLELVERGTTESRDWIQSPP